MQNSPIRAGSSTWKIFSPEFSKRLLRFGRAFLRDEAGQGLVEYVLIVGVVLSVVVVIAKPFFKTLRERVGESFEAGVFGKTDVNFYYFPLRRR